MIITHQHLDMDAIVSAFILKLELNDEVLFAKPDEIEQLDKKGNYIVDMNADVKEASKIDHHSSKERKCTAELIFEKFNLEKKFKPIVEIAHISDFMEKKENKYNTLTYLLRALRGILKSDEELFNLFQLILSALIKSIEDESKAEENFYKCEGKIISFKGYDIAVYDIPERKVNGNGINQWLFEEKKVSFIIVSNGYNQVLIRNSNLTEPDLSKMEVPDPYFKHPLGFLVANGTNKVPARTYPPLNNEQLLERLKTFIGTEGVSFKNKNISTIF